MTGLHSPFEIPVVAVTFVPGYPGNLISIIDAADEGQNAGEGLPAVLEREPDNKFDPLAIGVHVPSIGKVGHIPRDIAGRLAAEIDAGVTWQAEVVLVRHHIQHPEQPGLTIKCRRINA